MTDVSPAPALSFEQPIELSDVRAATWFIWRRTKLKTAVVGYVLAVLLGAWVGSRVTGAPPFLFELLFVAVIGGIGFAWMYWFLIERICKRAVARGQKEGSLTWGIADEGITLQSHAGQVKMNWSAIRGFILSKGRIYVSLPSGKMLFIPLRLLDAEQESQLLQMLRDKNIPQLA